MKETEIREQVLALCEVLDNKKALDILAVNVADKTIIADWFIIASGRSTTQVKALCDELEEKAAERGLIAPQGRLSGRPLDRSRFWNHSGTFVPSGRTGVL